MRYVLGVDGGQTSTTAVLAEETGRLLGEGHGGPANHIHEPGGVERVRQSLTDAIRGAREAASLPDTPIAAAYLGMTGGSAAMEEICRPVVPAERMTLGHDSLIALYSVTLGRPGVVVIGGTGSVGYGRNARGETARVGGWGYLMGDEGSAYWIGLRALNVCTRAEDGRGPRTPLMEPVLERLGVKTLLEAHRGIYSGAIGRPEIAALAEVVSTVASLSDHDSQRILQEAGTELGLLASAVRRRLGLAKLIEVGYVGGVFRAGRIVIGPFTSAADKGCDGAAIVPPRIPAVAAAVLLALEDLGVIINLDLIMRLHESLPMLGELKA